MDLDIIQIATAFFVVAMLYAAVGHGGGSGYLAVLAMTLMGPQDMRSTALATNLVVASIATWKFGRGHRMRWDILLPVGCASAPAAVVGGYIALPPGAYGALVGAVLLLAAARLAIPMRRPEKSARPPLWILVGAGAGIGLLSGMVGIGGGVFLSPLLLLLGWATMRQVAAISAPFILVNSAAALLGMGMVVGFPAREIAEAWPMAMAAAGGGLIGATIGSRHLGHLGLRRTLAVVLVLAAVKMVLR